jgi:hypothetical protein
VIGVSVEVLESLFCRLRETPVHDVHIPGYIDRDQGRHPRFSALPRSAYLELDEGFLHIEGLGDSGQLTMGVVSDFVIPEALAGEDEEFAVASIGHLFFDTAGPPLPITGIRYATTANSDPVAGIVRCVEVELYNAWPIFADPMWHFGIRLGGAGAYHRWVADADWREPEGVVEELQWRP